MEHHVTNAKVARARFIQLLFELDRIFVNILEKSFIYIYMRIVLAQSYKYVLLGTLVQAMGRR